MTESRSAGRFIQTRLTGVGHNWYFIQTVYVFLILLLMLWAIGAGEYLSVCRQTNMPACLESGDGKQLTLGSRKRS